jgi:hypothetical protein
MIRLFPTAAKRTLNLNGAHEIFLVDYEEVSLLGGR